MYTGLQEKYLFLFSYFSETVIFLIILKNTQISTFMKGSPMGAEYSMWMARRMDRQTDMMKLIVAINNFAKVPKWRS
jgi:hypothetical protein